MSGTIDDQLTVLFPELALLGVRKQIEQRFRRPAQFDAEWRHHDWPIDEDWVRHHCIEQLVISESWISEP